MSEDRATEILKNAILLEKRGQAFYAKVAQQAAGDAVKKFFNLMAEEEANHIRMLAEQFKSYHARKRFKTGVYSDQSEFKTVSDILTKDLMRQISAAAYEAAAIAAAMSMEKRDRGLHAQGGRPRMMKKPFTTGWPSGSAASEFSGEDRQRTHRGDLVRQQLLALLSCAQKTEKGPCRMGSSDAKPLPSEWELRLGAQTKARLQSPARPSSQASSLAGQAAVLGGGAEFAPAASRPPAWAAAALRHLGLRAHLFQLAAVFTLEFAFCCHEFLLQAMASSDRAE
jgi:rubrerythrin